MASSNKEVNNVVVQFVLQELSDGIEIDEYDPVIEYLASKRSRPAELMGTARIANYVEETVPTYSDPLFRTHFRMTRTSFQALLALVGPHTIVLTISLEKRTLACLWYLSNQEIFRGVADRFGLSKGSLHYYLENFCRAITGKEILASLISWPDKSEYKKLPEGFAQRTGFPGVIGAIDGTYIPITGPSEFRESYICRKGYPTFHLQGVCDSTLKFLDVYSAYPGSFHDSRVFKNSPLQQHLEKESLNQHHLLGVSAYSLSPFLLVAFRVNDHLSPSQKYFNYAHSSSRVDIERCFGLLKGKFRKLKFLDVSKVALIPSITVRFCALHNFIIKQESFIDDDIEITHEDNTAHSINHSKETSKLGLTKRNEIMNLLA